jgi:hypothetical protein
MSIKSMFLKLKNRFYLKFNKSHEMNEYDKMKIEMMLKNELKPEIKFGTGFSSPVPGQSNDRDVSAI